MLALLSEMISLLPGQLHAKWEKMGKTPTPFLYRIN
jgi:hypothetical protein